MKQTSYPGGYWEPGKPKYGVSKLHSRIRIPISDGRSLNAAMICPEGAKDEKFPVVIEWTCYSGRPDEYYARYGYISVMVWMQGTGGSDGEIRMGDSIEGEDAVHIIDWAVNLPQSNGDVAFMGASAPAAMALLAARTDARVKCIIVNNNALENCVRQSWFMSGVPTVGGIYYTSAISYIYGRTRASARWADKAVKDMEEGTGISYDSDFWKDRMPMRWAKDIVDNDVPVMMSTGYKDIMDNLIIKNWCAFQNAYAGRDVDQKMEQGQKVSSKWQLIYGDWSHMEALDAGLNLQWLETWVRGVDTGLQKTKKPLHLYEGGSGRWFNTDIYPVSRKSDQWYLGDNSTLGKMRSGNGSIDLQLAYPHEKNGFYTFSSEELREDYTIAGAISATIYASTTSTNLGIIATVCDVCGKNRIEVARGIILGSQSSYNREKTWFDDNGIPTYVWADLDKDEYLNPGEIYELHMNLACRQWKFEKGHRIVVELTNKSPVEYCPPHGSMPGNICRPGRYNKKQVASMKGGVFTVYFDEEHPTAVNLPVTENDAQDYVSRTGVLPNGTGFFGFSGHKLPLDWEQ
ncbi:MAG: hypothetical protein J6U50_08645 [Lachnospiraceae bacterium]|nr:hypothetical protein [Lachnospiraceae bacterium]